MVDKTNKKMRTKKKAKIDRLYYCVLFLGSFILHANLEGIVFISRGCLMKKQKKIDSFDTRKRTKKTKKHKTKQEETLR